MMSRLVLAGFESPASSVYYIRFHSVTHIQPVRKREGIDDGVTYKRGCGRDVFKSLLRVPNVVGL